MERITFMYSFESQQELVHSQPELSSSSLTLHVFLDFFLLVVASSNSVERQAKLKVR